MKKIMIPICALALIFMLSPMAFAIGDATNSTTNVRITVGTLTYDSSPNVVLTVSSSTTDYSISVANALTDTENGFEYATTSEASGYAMRTKTTAAGEGPVACTDPEAIPDGTWTWMGGS